MFLTEIGDNAKSFLNDDFMSQYSVAAIDLPENNKYGGTAILIKQGIGTVTPREDLEIKTNCGCGKCAVENSWVQLDIGKEKYIIAAVYRHCNGSIKHFNEQLENTLQKIDRKVTAILGGDININILNQEHTDTSDYTTTLLSHNFIPQILTPTRVTDDKATCLDHIFVRLPLKTSEIDIISGNIIAEVADHLPNFVYICKKDKPKVQNRPYVRLFGEKNMDKFKTLLDVTDWDTLLQNEDVDIACNDFYAHILLLYDMSFPYVRLSIRKSKHKEWITPGLIKCTQKKEKLFKKKFSNPTEENIKAFKRYRNTLTAALEHAENTFYQRKLDDKKDGIKNFWKTFGKTLNPNKSKTRSNLAKLIVDGKVITGDENISNEMNNFFCNVGKNIHDNIPNTIGSFTDYLKHNVSENFFLSAVTPVDVFKQLSDLNDSKSSGPDNLKPKLIKFCRNQFVKPLTILYNKSIEQAKYPSDFKLAKIIALYKKKSRFSPSNYRPISLLNCFNKLFEKLIYNQMINFIDKHKILYVNQYGFRKGHSTTLALIDVIDTLKKALDRKEYAIGIFLDLEKAFDTICHKILLAKLDFYGFRGHVNNFIKSYLSNRKQYAVVNGKKSECKYINYGVPQGSVLGPLFFLLFINDIHSAMKKCNGKLFADDTSLLLHHKTVHNLVINAEKAMDDISKWFKLNKLSLSHGKSKFLLFHNPKKDPCKWLKSIGTGDESIPRSDTVKYVGLHLDEKITWKTHIQETYNSLTKYFSIFYNIRNKINIKLARTIYYACIHSKLKYGIEIYGTASLTSMNKLQTLQNKLMKILTKKDYLHSTNLLHTDLDILKVSDIHRHSLLQFVYKCNTNQTIANFINYFPTRGEQHGLNLRNNADLDAAYYNREQGRTTVQRTGAVFWNQLTDNVKHSSSLNIFKNVLFKGYMATYVD